MTANKGISCEDTPKLYGVKATLAQVSEVIFVTFIVVYLSNFQNILTYDNARLAVFQIYLPVFGRFVYYR